MPRPLYETPEDYMAALLAENQQLLAALKIARQYVKATHGTIAPAVGENNLISPDLALVDAAIAKAEGNTAQ